MRIRSVAFLLAMLSLATPVIGAVCEMDCDQPPATSRCHESISTKKPTVRAAHHACDHDQAAGSPALLTSTSARDSVLNVAAVPLPALSHLLLSDARSAMAATHGPPGLSGRTQTSIRSTVLRI